MENSEKEVKEKLFLGMSDSESVTHQLECWVNGLSLHNPIRDECCPDFSCCMGDRMNKKTRELFYKAFKDNDEKTIMAVLVMALTNLTKDNDVYIAGEDQKEH